MPKYHINPNTGQIGRCKAEIECQFTGRTVHGSSPAETLLEFEKTMKTKIFPPVNKVNLDNIKLKHTGKKELENALLDLHKGSSKVTEALYLSSYCHEGAQRHTLRPGETEKDDYIVHPLRNAIRSDRLSGRYLTPHEREILSISSLLHDTLEDAPERIKEYYDLEKSKLSAQDITRAKFGNEIADTVEGLTNPDFPKGISKEEKNALYLEHVKEAIKNPPVLISKLMDLVDNAGSIKYIKNDEAKAKRLAAKYKPAIEAVIEEIPKRLENNSSKIALTKKAKKLLEDVNDVINR